MELKYIIPSVISLILSIIAFIPLVKWRLKSTEDVTAKQATDIQQIKDDSHRLEILILQNESASTTKSMEKMAEALLLIAESNSKFQSIIESQTLLIQKAHEASTRAHSRIDEHVKDNIHDLDDIKEKFVSHKHFDTVLEGIKK